MAKGILIFCGLLCFAVLVWVPSMLVSDNTEASMLNWLARTAENSKREAVLLSPEVQELDAENTRLHEELRAAVAACALEQPSWLDRQKQRIANLMPWS